MSDKYNIRLSSKKECEDNELDMVYATLFEFYVSGKSEFVIYGIFKDELGYLICLDGDYKDVFDSINSEDVISLSLNSHTFLFRSLEDSVDHHYLDSKLFSELFIEIMRDFESRVDKIQ